MAVVPRKLKESDAFLVCLQHKVAERNTLCDVAFQCMRQFAGYSMLVKQACFVCHKPGAPRCACQCACFCSKECTDAGWKDHHKLHALVSASSVTVEEECVQLLP